MKKLLGIVMVFASLMLLLAGCENKPATASNQYKAVLLLNGYLGDKSFNDSANEGLEFLKKSLGEKFEFKVDQMGATPADTAKWEPTLLDYCESKEYNLIIVGTWAMNEILSKAAKEYPNQKFLFYDDKYDFEANGNYNNIYNVLFKQNEVSFLVGAAATMVARDSEMEYSTGNSSAIGFIGGMENTVVQDFLIGYIQGAKYIDKDMKVVTAYVGNFYDSVAAKNLSMAQYNSGIEVGYNVASSAGLGQIEAAGELNKYVFGVDSDQASLLPEFAKNIPTSALKNVGNAIKRAIYMDMKEKLEFGVTEVLGLAEEGVGLVIDSHYEEMLSESIRKKLMEIQADIISGKIKVESAIGASEEDINKIIESAK